MKPTPSAAGRPPRRRQPEAAQRRPPPPQTVEHRRRWPRNGCSPIRTRPASYAAGGQCSSRTRRAAISNFQNYFSDMLHLAKNQYTLEPLQARGDRRRRHDPRPASARPRQHDGVAPVVHDPARRARTRRRSTRNRSSTDGSCWKRPPSTARPGVDPFFGPGAKNPSIGQVLLMSKEQLTEPDPLRPARPDLRLRTPRHPSRHDRPPDPRRPSNSSSPPALTPTSPGSRAAPTRPGQPAPTAPDPPAPQSTSPRSTASRCSATKAPARSPTSPSAGCSPSKAALKPDQIIRLMSYKGQTNTLALPDHANRLQITYTPLSGKTRNSPTRSPNPAPRAMAATDQPHQPNPGAGRADRARRYAIKATVRPTVEHGPTRDRVSPAPSTSRPSDSTGIVRRYFEERGPTAGFG